MTNNGGDPDSPLLLTAPHAGRYFPNQRAFQERLNPTVSLHELDRRGDTFTDGIAFPAAEKHGVTLLTANIAPIVINYARSKRSIAPGSIEGEITALTINPEDIFAPRGQGLFTTSSFVSGEPVFQKGRKWTEEEAIGLIESYYKPFHNRLEEMVARTQKNFGYTFILDVHSCPRYALPGEPDPIDTERPDIILGSNGSGNNASCPDDVVEAAKRLAEKHGYTVGINSPYRGGFITQKFGAHNRTCHGLNTHTLQIEFVRCAYGLDEEMLNLENPEAFLKAQRFMDDLVYMLDEHAIHESPNPSFI